MSSIFGTGAQTNAQNTTGGGLFGSNTNASQPAGGGLFGASTNQSGGGGLFGSTVNSNANQGSGGGLFGTNNTQNNTGGGLFGTNNAQPSGNTGGLFGSNTAQPNAGGGLFGNQSTTNNAGNAGSLFGNAAVNASAPNNSSLFGPSANINKTGPGTLFGNTTQPQQNHFGAAPAQSQNIQQPQMTSFSPQAMLSMGQSRFQVPQTQVQNLQASGYSVVPYERTVLDQIRTLAGKWNADDESFLLKTYLYNAVDKALAPFYYPNPQNGETEKGWEEALNNKPDIAGVPGAEGANLSYVPTLCRGFGSLGERIAFQARTVTDMQARLHEMNHSLDAVMRAHQQQLTVRLAAARRQHLVLAQRCLRLAVKVQVLRNRGYALDAAEEALRKTLAGLEAQVLDAGFAGREDEIWARMVALRERVRWLQEEGRRVAAAAQLDGPADPGASGDAAGVPEDVLIKTRKILKDYDDQLGHLSRELEDVKKEYAELETTQRR